MFSPDPLPKNKRLWNDTQEIIAESIEGIMLMHQNLVYIDSCQTVVRQDLDKLNGKVKIIGGGAVVNGLMYAGFVGSGMLTAAILGLHKSASCIPTSDAILEAINHAVKNDQQKDVLLLIHDCPEYYLNFTEARQKAQSNGISVKIVFIRDGLSEKLHQRPISSPKSASGLLLLYKIAGAMSEEDNSLDEIFNTCYEIIRQKAIYSTGVYVIESYDETAQINISRGDVLSDREKKCFPIEKSSASNVTNHLISDMMAVDNYQKFTQGSKLAILLDYFNGFSELETNIIIKELVQQLNKLKFKVRIIYSGSFHVSFSQKGFHLSVLNMSNNLKYLYYLNVPTAAYAWPKTNSREILLKLPSNDVNQTQEKCEKYRTRNHDPKLIKEVINNTDSSETDILLSVINYACDTLIACFMKIDMLDDPNIPPEVERCGTRLAFTADIVKNEIINKKFNGLSPSDVLFYIAQIFDNYRKDAQAELYKLFLSAIGKEIVNKRNLGVNDWLSALVRAISSIGHVVQGSKFFDALDAARNALCNAYAEDVNINVIHALDKAVNAAQKLTAHIFLESGEIPEHLLNKLDYGFLELAGAHAVGVWMRGAYEGIKLIYMRQKRKRLDDSEGEDVSSKTSKYSYD